MVLKYYYIFFLLCAFSIKAQSHYEFYKPVDTINAILNKNQYIFYVEKGEIIKSIKKVQVNQRGEIYIVTTSTKEIDSSFVNSEKSIFLDLFEYETIEISGSQLIFKDQNNKTYRTLYNINNKDVLKLKQQIETLKASCQKIRSIEIIKEYYADFKTGYDTPGGFFTVTDNYKVSFVNNIFTMSFNTYMYKEFQKKETISFNVKDILNIYDNGTVYLEFENGFVIQPVSSSIGFKSKKIDYFLYIKLEKYLQSESTEIYKAFEELIKKIKQ